MDNPGNDPLLLAGKVLVLIMQGAMALGAAIVLIVLPFATFLGGDIAKGFEDGSGLPVDAIPTIPVVGLLLVVFGILAALFMFLGKLRAIIDTVSDGDPFMPSNAARLNAMAWLLLGAQALKWPASVLGLIVAEWANEIDEVNMTITFDALDLTALLMVIVLFILARVFRHGAAMREDLEGTV
jgi:hypothetical protein